MAKDPRSMTPKGRPGSAGTATGGRAKQTAAPKKKAQANGKGAVAGYQRKKPPTRTATAKQVKAKQARGSRSTGDQTPGRTNYSYGGKS